MKRTPLIRKSPLRRGAPLRRVSASKYSQRERDPDRMAWVRGQPCAARYLGGCEGRIDPDHAGRRPMGKKAPDDTCIPMCRLHHRQRDTFAGPFRTWDQNKMREWLAVTVRVYQLLYSLHSRPDR